MKLLLTLFTSLFLFGCSGGIKSPTSAQVPAAPVLTKISLSPAIASIRVGEEQTYTAQALDQYQNPITGITFTWTSSDDGANGSAIAMAVSNRRVTRNNARHSIGLGRYQRTSRIDRARISVMNASATSISLAVGEIVIPAVVTGTFQHPVFGPNIQKMVRTGRDGPSLRPRPGSRSETRP